MKPAPFDYLRAEDMAEATAALARHGGDARILAGGQSLIAMLNMRLLAPAVLVDISRLEALRYLRRADGAVEVGAAATQAELQAWPELAECQPLLALAMPWVGHFQTRNKGTVCGSIAHADPSSELPLCLALLDGKVVLQSARGSRAVGAADFQRGMLSTACAEDELIAAVRFPVRAAGAGYAFEEVAMRHGDFAIVAVGAQATAGALRIAVGGVADRPAVRDYPVLQGDALDDALNELAWDLGAIGDQHASARYRRHLVRRVGRRVAEEALRCRA